MQVEIQIPNLLHYFMAAKGYPYPNIRYCGILDLDLKNFSLAKNQIRYGYQDVLMVQPLHVKKKLVLQESLASTWFGFSRVWLLERLASTGLHVNRLYLQGRLASTGFSVNRVYLQERLASAGFGFEKVQLQQGLV